ncbi:acyl-CoA dehydrogenase family protein [Nocardioides hankookensis]
MSTQSPYELSREHEEFRRTVRAFAEAEIAPHAAQWDREHHFPVDVVQKMGALGLFGLTAPEEYGGAGEDGDFTSLCVAIEEIGRVDQSMGITLEAAVGLGINPILTYGTDEQKQTWLPDLVAAVALELRGRRGQIQDRTCREALSSFEQVLRREETPLG